MNYYKVIKKMQHVTTIQSRTGEFMYLVEGKEKAALIDTCLGVGNLKKFVEELTDKPVVVIITHGHVDHAMGAPEFDEVYMNNKDIPVYQENKPLLNRKGYIKWSLMLTDEEVESMEYVLPSDIEFGELEEGKLFDLGGITLEIYEVPGHTPGSIGVLIREERTLILGDACNTFTFLFDQKALPVEEYKEVLQRLDRLTKGKYDKVCLSHGFSEVSTQMIASVIAVCDDILNGTADDEPMEFMGMNAWIAKAVDKDKNRVDGGLGNIIYNRDKIYKS